MPKCSGQKRRNKVQRGGALIDELPAELLQKVTRMSGTEGSRRLSKANKVVNSNIRTVDRYLAMFAERLEKEFHLIKSDRWRSGSEAENEREAFSVIWKRTVDDWRGVVVRRKEMENFNPRANPRPALKMFSDDPPVPVEWVPPGFGPPRPPPSGVELHEAELQDKLLLDAMRHLIRYANLENVIYLMLAGAGCGSREMVGLALDSGLDLQEALGIAVDRCEPAAVATLLELGADTNVLCNQLPLGNGPTYRSYLQMAAGGPNRGKQPLFWPNEAASRLDAITSHLLEQGAKTTVPGMPREEQPLYLAIARGRPRSVSMLITAGATFDIHELLPAVDTIFSKKYGQLPNENDWDVVRILIDQAGAGNILTAAAGGGYERVVMYLLEAGVDPTEDAVRMAAASGHRHIRDLLSKAASTPQLLRHQRALGLAIEQNRVGVLMFLLEGGVTIDFDALAGPIEKAREKDYRHILSILYQMGR